MKIKVIYEDNHIIVVEKPPNIASCGDKTNDISLMDYIKQYLKEKYKKPGDVYLGLIHRLDRPVGGVMVYAKTSKGAARLSEQVRNGEIKKTYLAVVLGHVESSGTIENYLYKDERNNISRVVDENKKNAKFAKLDYEVVNYIKEEDISLLKVNLHTGRHHQIRVQLASIGHSIYGDHKYGKANGKQIALWAHKLTIKNPISKEEMTFESIPEAIGIWNILRQ